MAPRFACGYILLVAIFCFSVFGCATQPRHETRTMVPRTREAEEGELEAIPEPVSPQKSVPVTRERTSEFVEAEMPETVEESDVISGYRVQIFASSSLEKAEDIAGRARTIFPERVYVEYSAPLYRVRVGNFDSKEDALALRERAVEAGYEGAWVVEALIERE